MIHNFQKRWVFTWNAEESGHLVDWLSLQNLLSEIAKEGMFQKEKGNKTCRFYYQNRFELKGPRIGNC